MSAITRIAVARKRWSLSREMLTLYFALTHSRSPWYARLTACISLLYLISPIDIIPDLIPFAGYIDDILVVPFLLNLSGRFIPDGIRLAASQKAGKYHSRFRLVLIGVLLLLAGCMALLFVLAAKLLHYMMA